MGEHELRWRSPRAGAAGSRAGGARRPDTVTPGCPAPGLTGTPGCPAPDVTGAQTGRRYGEEAA